MLLNMPVVHIIIQPCFLIRAVFQNNIPCTPSHFVNHAKHTRTANLVTLLCVSTHARTLSYMWALLVRETFVQYLERYVL